MHHPSAGAARAATGRRAAAAAFLGCAVLGSGVLTACSSPLGGTPTSAAEHSPQPTGSAQAPSAQAGAAQETAEPEVLGQLNSDQMMQVLLGPADLVESPEGHSTYTGVDYFHQEIAVEVQDYRNRFGPGECPTTMDSINVDLVGEGAEEGLMHMYQFAEEDGSTSLLYVWALAYDREVDTTEVWDTVAEHCDGAALSSGGDSVEIASFESGGFTGVQLDIHKEFDGAAEQFGTFSVVNDAGQNLVMMSSVGLGQQRFTEIVEAQERKLAEFDQHDDGG